MPLSHITRKLVVAGSGSAIGRKSGSGPRPGRLGSLSLFLILIVGYLLFNLGQAGYRLYNLDKQLAVYQSRQEQLARENQNFQMETNRLQDKNYIERQAREQLGLVKPGEKVIIPALPGNLIPRSSVKPYDLAE